MVRSDAQEVDALLEAYEKGAGTYLRVTRFPRQLNSDVTRLLYLRPNGSFLFVASWPGYEPSIATGRWTRSDSEIHLEGIAQVSTDTIPGPGGGRFRLVFAVEVTDLTPYLTAREDLDRLGMLGSVESLAYVGRSIIIAPDDISRLPRSLDEVDAWIGSGS